MAAFAKWDQIDGEFIHFDGGVGTKGAYQKVVWTLYPGADQLARSVHQSHPQGVDGILIGLRKVPGYHVAVGANGIIAILIGLLLPAVQKMAAGSSADLRILSGALKQQGQVAFAMGDGSVRLTAVNGGPVAAAPGSWIDVLSVGVPNPGALAMKSVYR
ncbi:hypothetical protein [Piscinibacter sakaiensis]|uniref:hypothetical protein n=1 Tax=Piscinibacter sakaiensis TaxID=1547922 RepID=UPI003AB0E1F4